MIYININNFLILAIVWWSQSPLFQVLYIVLAIVWHLNSLSVPYLPLFACIYLNCGPSGQFRWSKLCFYPILKFVYKPAVSIHIWESQLCSVSCNLWDLRSFLPLWSMGKFLMGYTALWLGLRSDTAKLQKNC